jgi:PEP-CTERM motif
MLNILRYSALVFGLLVVTAAPGRAAPIVIDFDDVTGTFVDITNRYASLGVTLHAIDNPFPLFGPFPTSATLPTILGGVTTWLDPFQSATSPTQVAVAAPTPVTGQGGNGGILISFAFDVSFVSVIGNDAGGIGFDDDESVTLTAFDALGTVLGSVYSTVNLPGDFDQTPATIAHPGIRHVAFNYTDSLFGFYAMDDLQFTPVPEPSTGLLLLTGSLALGLGRSRRKDSILSS